MWRPQLYEKEGLGRGIDPTVLENSLSTSQQITDRIQQLPPLLTLRHLAYISDVDYLYLRSVVGRSNEDPYRTFRILKRPCFDGELRFRLICIPDKQLMKVQRWIAQNILSVVPPHSASVAYSKQNTVRAAAEPHCECRWLIKLDIKNFFESISEISGYRVFRSLGYQPLISFELARICTRLGSASRYHLREKWLSKSSSRPTISAYGFNRMGHLPQGAPTSPMLSNLTMLSFDNRTTKIAREAQMTYTRYADDLLFSTSDRSFKRGDASRVIGKIYALMGEVGLAPNVAKSNVSPPGARKLALGLLVDSKTPRLTRDFRANLRRHLYYLSSESNGPAIHANRRGFTSILGLKHHIRGLIAFAQQIEPDYGTACLTLYDAIDWPV